MPVAVVEKVQVVVVNTAEVIRKHYPQFNVRAYILIISYNV